MRTLLLVLSLLFPVLGAAAQLAANPAVDPGLESASFLATPTKADLAQAYQRLDREFAATRAESDDPRPEVHTGFDNATLAYFTGNIASALAAIDRETALLRVGNDLLPQHVLSLSLQVRIDPPVWRPGLDAPRIAAAPLYAFPFDRTNYAIPLVTVALRDADGAAVVEHEFEFADDPQWPQSNDLFPDGLPADLKPGTYTITSRWSEGRPREFEVGRWHVTPRSLDALRESNESRLNLVATSEPDLAGAVALVRSRNALLTDNPSPDILAEWLADPNELAEQIAAEIEALEQGRHPFADRPADRWMRASLAGADCPMRIYEPASLGDGPAPVVIAIHGMGGDENMLLDGASDGVLRRLADEHGFVVIAPESSAMAYPASFDALLDVVATWRNVDRDRVYLVGHSMGATLASALAKSRPGAIAAICMIAGAPALPSDAGARFPPALLIGGELDSLARASALVDAAANAKEKGLDVRAETLADQGHTLLLGDALTLAVEWFFAQR